ncbi:hypothetical protein [Tahibacter amnicola]|uniref:Lipoprotein n=1 Tax=Tahibacter amnicola TaxID=2976241 RepID=A0ABY6BIF8_9GAMM|nr:hypothetical protein [Tahibacter amnicola]UXI69549.1 hypothetical protein N4264_07870 [Tahibacter amnicola]
MQRFALSRILRGVILASAAALALSACSGRTRPTDVAAPDVPSTFDVVLKADKDGQYDMDGATLSEEDVKGNLRFRRDTNNPAKTVLLKRAEKQKVSDRHVAGLARIGFELKVRTFLQEKEGEEITEVRTQAAAQ